MGYKEIQAKYDRLQEIHTKKFNVPRNSEAEYQESIFLLKKVHQELEEAAKAEGVSIPVVLWG